MNIYLIRHGESVWNMEGRVQGRGDPGLSVQGKRQARAVAKRVKKEKIGLIYASSLKRSAQTAGIIASETGAKIRFRPDIQEIILGAWQGKTIDEIKRLYPGSYAAWLKSPSKARIPGWEGVPNFTRRINRAFRSIIDTNSAGNICVVTHWGVIAAFLSRLIRTDFDWFFKTVRIDNCAIHKLSFQNGKAVIECINDTKHLS